jgi:DNA replication and repair protein RecF
MYLQNLTLKNFRVFSDIDITFNNGINIISGPNGQGKTSILESIYYLALTRSFRSTNDNNAIKYNDDYFRINGNISIKNNKNMKVILSYSINKKKNLFLNKKKVNKFSSYLGKIPCVLLTLNDLKLTMGLPSNRRYFMDILLSQVSPIYLQNLKTYKKIVQQRNKLLNENTEKHDLEQIEVWNKQLIEYGSYIINDRINFIEFMNKKINEYYHKFTVFKENISVNYKSSFKINNKSDSLQDIKKKFKEKLIKYKLIEKEKRTTIIGPHRDDIEFLKDNKSFKEYGSQGENKTLIIVLKILEWLYVTNQNKKTPLMLLDDIFGELDRSRINGLLNFLDGIGQSFITTTIKNKFSDLSNKKNIYLENSNIIYG